jgi:hypothetical protein
MEHEKVIARIYERLEADDVEQAVAGCIHLARNSKDYLSLAIFLRELSSTQEECGHVLYTDISNLKTETQKLLGDIAHRRWLKTHTLDFSLLPEKPDHNVFCLSVRELESEIRQLERSIAGMVVPPGMRPCDTEPLIDMVSAEKASLELLLKASQKLKGRLKSRCHNYASQREYQLALQTNSHGFLDASRTTSMRPPGNNRVT